MAVGIHAEIGDLLLTQVISVQYPRASAHLRHAGACRNQLVCPLEHMAMSFAPDDSHDQVVPHRGPVDWGAIHQTETDLDPESEQRHEIIPGIAEDFDG